MKQKIILFVWVFIIIFESCKDIIFNNPLDPNASIETLQIVKIVPTGLMGEGDLAYDGEKFWKISVTGGLYAFDAESGAVIRSLAVRPGTGVAVLRDKIYICNGENILYAYDSLSGDLIDQISTVELYPAFLTTLDDRLLLYDQRSTSFYRYEPETGATELLFQISGVEIGGIETYGDGVLFTDKKSNSIYQYNLDGNLINAYLSPAESTVGISIDNGSYIYLLTLDGQLYKVSLP